MESYTEMNNKYGILQQQKVIKVPEYVSVVHRFQKNGK